MNCWEARDANELLVKLVTAALIDSGNTQASRLGPTLDLGPCMIRLSKGANRLTDLPARALNPIFAMVEACWILKGRNDLAPLLRHVKRMRLFSDDGVVLNGAYGHRLQYAFGCDQMSRAIEALRRDPESRRIVLSLYHPNDLGSASKDIPCNTSIMLRVVRDELCITVINRSNDILFGLPYNIFCFALIQQFIADALGVPAGEQVHFSNSMHIYSRNLDLAHQILQGSQGKTMHPAPDMASFFRLLVREANAIGTAEFGSISDAALRDFLSRFAIIEQGTLLKSCKRDDIAWLNEMLYNWSQRMHGSLVAALED